MDTNITPVSNDQTNNASPNVQRNLLLESLRWQKFGALDKGYVCLVDIMGSDEAIVQAARVSYGEGTKIVSTDRNLIRYLMRHRHTSPLEMSELKFLIHTPMDCWRQWIRHRTACLSGATKVRLRDINGKPWNVSMVSVYRLFQMKLGIEYQGFKPISPSTLRRFDNSTVESLNEHLDTPQMNKIVDIWQSGVKQVFRVTTTNGSIFEASDDHRCYTNQGWVSLKDIKNNKNIELATIVQLKDNRPQNKDTPAGIALKVHSRLDKATVWGLEVQYDTIYKIEDLKEQETYDLQVIGPWENFSAGGVIVHNSVNEYSTRYSVAIDEAQHTPPDRWRSQSTNNKQGSGVYIDSDAGQILSDAETTYLEESRKIYQDRLDQGVAREQARKDLPLSTYTSAYWKINLHNLLHFLSLRMDTHAQLEIRTFATIIGEQIVKPLFPMVWEAFEDYRLYAMSFSKQELFIMGRLLNTVDVSETNVVNLSDCWPTDSRERTEFISKLKKLVS